MKYDLQLDDKALWKQRFRAPVVAWTRIARANPTRGLAVTNSSGKYQLYAWDVPSGTLRQLTNWAAGLQYPEISGDGRYIYYMDDDQGNEIGHFVRVPFENGEAQDLTPEWLPYSSLEYLTSASGSHFGFVRGDDDGFRVYSIETNVIGEIGIPFQLFHSSKMVFGPLYSYAGEVAVIATTDRATVLDFNLAAFDTATGEQIAELWDGTGTSLDPLLFSPQAGDLRLTGTTNRTGLKRPFIWNPRTDERLDLDFPGLTGEVVPFDWSHDSEYLLLCQFNQAVQQLYLYNLKDQRLKKLNHPSGTYGLPFANAGVYF